MPKELHEELKQRADKKGLTGEDRENYIFGTLQKVENQRKRKRQSTDSNN